MANLIDTLSKVDKLSDSDEEWYRFVCDHREAIILTASTINITPNLMSVVKHNLTRFIRHINRRIDDIWIIYYINDINTDMDFYNVSSLLIPNASFIDELYSSYTSTKRIVTKPKQ